MVELPRSAKYWMERMQEDRNKLNNRVKLEVIRAFLLHTTSLTPEEVDVFTSPKEKLSDPDSLTGYAIVERKVARIFSGDYPEKWESKTEYLSAFREALKEFYTFGELDEIQTYIETDRDASAVTVWLASDSYAWRRVRNAYLPEITDFVETGSKDRPGRDLTASLFKEGAEDAVSRIERILGKE
jgi:hypothetical protein